MKKKIGKTMALILMLGMISVSVAGCYFANASAELQLQIEPQIDVDEDEMIDHIDVDDGEDPLTSRPELDPETVLRIKQDYINSSLRRQPETIDNIVIHRYYGTYNNNTCVVLALSSIAYVITDVYIPGGTETVAGKSFYYGKTGFIIYVWREGAFYSLGQAHAQNLLTDDDIETIWNIHQK